MPSVNTRFSDHLINKNQFGMQREEATIAFLDSRKKMLAELQFPFCMLLPPSKILTTSVPVMLASSSVSASPEKWSDEVERPWTAAPMQPVAIMDGGYIAKVYSTNKEERGIRRKSYEFIRYFIQQRKMSTKKT